MHQPSKFARTIPWIYLAALAGVNLYICRDTFSADTCCHWNTMQGEWMTLARLARFDWLHPTWWRYWGGGEPLEHTYSPLVPFLLAVLSHAFHWSLPRSLNILTAAVYCAGPPVFFLVSWRLSKRPGYSFAAALAWSLLSPVLLLLPDTDRFSVLDPRRLDLAFNWDDLPHLTSLLLFPIALWSLARTLETRRRANFTIAGFAMAGMMLANMFGFVLVALLVLTVPLALHRAPRFADLIRAATVAVATYVIVSPWLTPSLLLTMRDNEARNGENPWTWHSALALATVAAATWAVWRLSARFRANWAARWLLLAGTPAILIPALAQYAGWHFLPQPHRYKTEAEIAIVWMAVFALPPIVARIPRAVGIVLLAPLLLLAGRQISAFHDAATRATSPVDTANSIQHRVAEWVSTNLSGQRVMLAGSLGAFQDLFAAQDEFSAEPYTTGPNFEQKIAVYTLYTGANAGDLDASISLLWLQAFGVRAIAVPGPKSPEYWKPFVNPRKFEGVLPVLWRQDDTTIYQVPLASPGLAHVLRPEQLVHDPPRDGLHTGELRTFVAALDSAPKGATVAWDDPNHARIRTSLDAGEIVSTQITYHPGWQATVNGVSRPVRADGLGLMAIDAGCRRECEIRLAFDGGREWKICLAASIVTVVLLAAVTIKAR